MVRMAGDEQLPIEETSDQSLLKLRMFHQFAILKV